MSKLKFFSNLDAWRSVKINFKVSKTSTLGLNWICLPVEPAQKARF